ncbi:MAG: DUF3822 family protein [Ichthyobacteriaceae bacterium]|nr:DUF3822 family protein [Ichthyobacteriaceae bacterium]
MLKPRLNRVDKSLESEHFNNIELSIQLQLNGFSFCIINKDLNKVVAIVDYVFDDVKNSVQLRDVVAEIFKTSDLLNLKFSNVKVSHVNSISTLVPEPLFEPENLKDYLGFTQKLLNNEFLAYDKLDNLDVVNIYSPYDEVNDFLVDLFGEFEYKHNSTILIENLIKRTSISELKCYVNVHEKHFEIIVIKEKQLLLYNTFEYSSPEDFVYFVLFVAEQLKLNTDYFLLELFGEIEEYTELYQLLYKYVRNVKFGQRSDKYNYSYVIDTVKNHKYFEILNQ